MMTICFVPFEHTDPELFIRRCIKKVVHELGHCDNPECVMYFSNRRSDTDHRVPDFCETCQRKLQQ